MLEITGSALMGRQRIKMADLEKVVKGLETCIKYIDQECPISCPYHEICRRYEGRVVFQPVLRDALTMLKEHRKKDNKANMKISQQQSK